MKSLASRVFKTGHGWAGVAVTDRGVCRIVLPMKSKRSVAKELKNAERCLPGRAGSQRSFSKDLTRAVTLLRRYFCGVHVDFDLPLDLRGHTPFQQTAWKSAMAIPRGETRSYGWIAKQIRRPGAARAVGRAMGANPVPVIVP
jgi:methylated-DNA-[protein]-cysteine S-methyltransferase